MGKCVVLSALFIIMCGGFIRIHIKRNYEAFAGGKKQLQKVSALSQIFH